jgi:multiple sugar transport system substrate-binding protein
LIVFPSLAIGELCEAKAILPVRPSVLKSAELRFADFLPLVRDHEVVYAQQVMALPIGCPTPLLLAPGEAEPADIALPEGEIKLALAYLAWAAPYAEHRSRVSTLLDSDTLRPRLAEPPFVRALESLAAAAGAGPNAVTWPQREAPIATGLTPRAIPGAAEVFNPIGESWEPVPLSEQKATLVASRGRLVGVTSSSRNAATAFRYAAWLVGPENSQLVSTASDNVANCRGSFARSPDAWRAADDRDLGRRFAEAQAAALRSPRFLLAPRLPGASEYLKALGAQVRQALAGRPPAEVLQEAADEWEAIHEARGRDEQKAAYARSINAAEFL